MLYVIARRLPSVQRVRVSVLPLWIHRQEVLKAHFREPTPSQAGDDAAQHRTQAYPVASTARHRPITTSKLRRSCIQPTLLPVLLLTSCPSISSLCLSPCSRPCQGLGCTRLCPHLRLQLPINQTSPRVDLRHAEPSVGNCPPP